MGESHRGDAGRPCGRREKNGGLRAVPVLILGRPALPLAVGPAVTKVDGVLIRRRRLI